MPNHPLLLGHRGVRSEKSIPENSLASFDLALALGCDGFEFDVRLSADQQAVICHDATSRGNEIAASPAEQLCLPSLGDVLTRYQSTSFLDIELKVCDLEKTTVDLLRMIRPARGFVVSSFLPGVLQTLHKLEKTIPLGLICETREELIRWTELPVEYVIPHYKLVRKDLIAEIKNAGKRVFVWTVNVAGDMKRFSAWGVNGVISDNPKLLRPFSAGE
ncbi:MAG: glycerophosphodiester phosphodiesterase [Candidatus Sulfotelmatobacter sp.]|jgi:glycerophosphoryl diester phosphodiesterase